MDSNFELPAACSAEKKIFRKPGMIFNIQKLNFAQNGNPSKNMLHFIRTGSTHCH
jgi:hypothetical protein